MSSEQRKEAKAKWNAIINKQTPLDDVLQEFELLFEQWSDVTTYSPIIWINQGRLSELRMYGDAVERCFKALLKLYPEDNRVSQYRERWEHVKKEKHKEHLRDHEKMLLENYETVCPQCGKVHMGQEVYTSCYNCGKRLTSNHVRTVEDPSLPICPGCGERIKKGSDVKYLPDGRMVHSNMMCWKRAIDQ